MARNRQNSTLGGEDPMGINKQPDIASELLAGLREVGSKVDKTNEGISEVKERLTAVETTLKGYPGIEDKVNRHETAIDGLKIQDGQRQKDIGAINDNIKYWSRWIVGAVGMTLVLAFMQLLTSGALTRIMSK